jgi:hypothetical protein
MANWYKVTKRINGRLYDYWQRTERQGKSTKTLNKYIGPHSATFVSASGDYYVLRIHPVTAALPQS